MRLARIRFGEGLGGTYHAMSRFAGGAPVFDVRNGACPRARYFLELMRKLEAFHGMMIVTYAILSTHIHLLVREPAQRLTSISDEDLIEKIRLLNGRASAAELRWKLNHLRTELNSADAAEALKARYLKRMGDISAFMQDLKGRFSQWHNKQTGRYGVLWADRFKSVLVEDGAATWTMAAYIDLNCVRAGLANDPKDYRYCGYGAACGGDKQAREGLKQVYALQGGSDWRGVAKDYRKLLFSEGEQRVPMRGERVRRGISPERVKEVLAGDGELTVPELIQCRVRYFADGLAFGSAQFVERIFQTNRSFFGKKRKDGARKLARSELSGLRTLRDLRKTPVEAIASVTGK